MIDNNNYKNIEYENIYTKKITEENIMLFDQLLLVEEELANYYYKLKNYGENFLYINSNNSFSETSFDINKVITENIKLQSLVSELISARKFESQNSIATRLGEILINGVSSVKNFIKLPFKLHKIWSSLEQKTPPAILGGKDFHKVVDAYLEGGMISVDKLLKSSFFSSVMCANAYTALAKKLMSTDPKQASKFARLAWETDPRPYRLKWLAFRTHEANDAIKAEALLNLLPDDIKINEAEQRHINRIHRESEIERMKLSQDILKKYQKKSIDFKELINKHNKLIEENKKQQERYQFELKCKNDQLINIKKSVDQSQQENNKLREELSNIKLKIESQKKESEVFGLQTAMMVKTLLNQFEPDRIILSRIIRIILGTPKIK